MLKAKRNCSTSIIIMAVFVLITTINLSVSGEFNFTRCYDNIAKLVPCEPYVNNRTDKPSEVCCSEMQSLDNLASSSPKDRKFFCECLELTAPTLPLDFNRVVTLVPLCHLKVQDLFDLDLDCDKYVLILFYLLVFVLFLVYLYYFGCLLIFVIFIGLQALKL